MKTVQKSLFIGMIICMLPACVSLNKNTKEELDLLSAKVTALEADIQKLDQQDQQLRQVVAGEQKRGEYMQQQIAQVANKLQSDIAGLQSVVTSIRTTSQRTTSSKTTSSSTSEKFISDKMPSPPPVTDVQLALRNAGFYDGAIDGKPGSQSRNAVRAFQKKNQLTVDGIVGKVTWERLRKYL